MTKKSKVLERKAFQDKDADVENVGIMQGFIDMLVSEEDEPEDEQDMAVALGRTPDNPEILMNTLSGEMRSIDARREELADQVGYAAAMETPDSVLALLQVKQEEGIGALPQGMPQGMPPMMPPGNPPMMPPASPPPGGIASLPTDQGPMPQPVRMKKGGIVQNFKLGGLSSSEIQNLVGQSMKVPTIAEGIPANVKMLQDIGFGLGDDYLNQQAYLGAAGSFFDFAEKGNTGDLIKNLINVGTQRGALKAKDDLSLKKAAIPLAQAQRQSALDYNTKLEQFRKEVALKNMEMGSKPFGAGDFQNILANADLIERYGKNETNQEETLLVETALAEATQKKQYFEKDPYDPEKLVPRFYTPYNLSPTVKKAIADRKELKESGVIVPGPTEDPENQKNIENLNLDNQVEANPIEEVSISETSLAPNNQITLGSNNQITLASTGPQIPKGPTELSTEQKESLKIANAFDLADVGTGFVPKIKQIVADKGSILGTIFADELRESVNAETILESMKLRLAASMREGNKFYTSENDQILKELIPAFQPALLKEPATMRARLVALDTTLLQKIKQQENIINDPKVEGKLKRPAREQLNLLKTIRTNLGVPPRFRFIKDENDKIDLRSSYNRLKSIIENEKPTLYSRKQKNKDGKFELIEFYKVITPNNKVLEIELSKLQKLDSLFGK